MTGTGRRKVWLVVASVCLATALATAQEQQKQEIPDAPSATRPVQPFPTTPPSAAKPEPQDTNPAEELPASPPSENETPASPPPLKITTVPEGGATQEASQEDLFRLATVVNQVLVPVMVKDQSGRMVSGLLPKDFVVYEDGAKQELNFFTSDAFPLSAAVILDLGMSDAGVQKVNQTFSALQGAFSQFDEVSIYAYSGSVSRIRDFGAVSEKLTAVLNELKTKRGRNTGVPVTGGPMGPQGPTINNVPVGSGVAPVVTPPPESHVLNDAILMAALDLSKRDRARRKIIFVISDGREYRSTASYRDVLKVLLSHGIMVYGASLEGLAMPGYSKLTKLHLPRLGYSNILPKYANATGGEIYPSLSKEAIESTYARAIGEARNQYTLGYKAGLTRGNAYRLIEVVVKRPDVKVLAKDGYYPLPAVR